MLFKKCTAAFLCALLLFSSASCRSPEDSSASAENTGSSAEESSFLDNELALTDESLLSAEIPDDNARVFYEIFTGSFSDSDGDGIGDLRGILNRIDYLNDGDPDSGKSLGVEGLWLTPVFDSVSYHKYDVTDYYSIDPDFGSEEDLKALTDACHERGMKLILDLPINHTGSRNIWFTMFTQAHKNGNPKSKYYDYYSWYREGETPPSRGTFRKIDGTDDWYECNFDSGMPELNFDNENVREDVLNIARYYMNLGVDGFRFDAAKYVYYGDNEKSAAFWEWYSGALRVEYPGIYIVYEVWDTDSLTYPYNTSGSCFDFTVSGAEGLIAEAAHHGNMNKYMSYIGRYLSKLAAAGDDALFTPFIANHDMDRAAGFLTVASGQMQFAANVLLLSPGSPFIYYGEEIGMKGTRGGSGTDANRRLGMLWGDGDTVKDPEGTTYDPAKQTNGDVAGEIASETSLYTHYKKLIMIRKANPEIARGEYTALSFSDTKVGGFTSTYNGSTVAVIHNPCGSTQTVDLSSVTDLDLTELRAFVGMGSATLDGTTLTLDSYTSVVLK